MQTQLHHHAHLITTIWIDGRLILFSFSMPLMPLLIIYGAADICYSSHSVLPICNFPVVNEDYFRCFLFFSSIPFICYAFCDGSISYVVWLVIITWPFEACACTCWVKPNQSQKAPGKDCFTFSFKYIDEDQSKLINWNVKRQKWVCILYRIRKQRRNSSLLVTTC